MKKNKGFLFRMTIVIAIASLVPLNTFAKVIMWCNCTCQGANQSQCCFIGDQITCELWQRTFSSLVPCLTCSEVDDPTTKPGSGNGTTGTGVIFVRKDGSAYVKKGNETILVLSDRAHTGLSDILKKYQNARKDNATIANIKTEIKAVTEMANGPVSDARIKSISQQTGYKIQKEPVAVPTVSPVKSGDASKIQQTKK